MSLAGCERLAMGPAGATSQVLLVRRGNVAGSAGQVGSTASAGWVGAVRWGRVVGALGRRRHLGGRPDVVVSQGEGAGAS